MQGVFLMKPSAQSTGVVTDIDGNSYSIVEIAGLRWMAENLRTTRYCNGDTINHVPRGGMIRMGNSKIWGLQNEGAWCYYGDKTSARDIHREMAELNAYYGKLYNWYAVSDERNVCPCGWHPATAEEWNRIEETFGKGRATGLALKSNHDGFWKHPDETPTGQSGFEGIPSGRRQTDGFFEGFGTLAYWWTADESTKVRSEAPFRSLWFDPEVNTLYQFGSRLSMPKNFGAAVRCVEDYPGQAKPERAPSPATPTSTVVEDIDGNRYHTVIIGRLEWLMSDLQTSRFSNGDPIPHVEDRSAWTDLETPAYTKPYGPEVTFEIRGKHWPLMEMSVLPPVVGDTEKIFTPADEAPPEAIPLWEALESDWSVAPESIRFYNGYTAVDERGVCPAGWRLPSEFEMRNFVNALGGDQVAATTLRNEVEGFLSAYPGTRSQNGIYMFPGLFVSYWTGSSAWGGASLNAFDFSATSGRVNRYNTRFSSGKSIRCVREVEQSQTRKR